MGTSKDYIIIGESRINKLRFINDIITQDIKISNKFITKMKYILIDYYNMLLENNELLIILIILLHADTNQIPLIEHALFNNNFKTDWTHKIEELPRGVPYIRMQKFDLIRKILYKDLKIDDILLKKILTISNIDKSNITSNNNAIAYIILLSKDLNLNENESFYVQIKKAILNETYDIPISIDFKSIHTYKDFMLQQQLTVNDDTNNLIPTAIETLIKNDKNKSIKTLEQIIKKYQDMILKKKEEEKTGGKKKTKYNIFMSKELKRLKKINPDKDYKLRFKEAVNNWKNKK